MGQHGFGPGRQLLFTLVSATCTLVTCIKVAPNLSSNVFIPESSNGSAKGGLLVFYAVGTQERTMRLVTDNLKHFRRNYTEGPLDVFLAHYDMGAEKWRRQLGENYSDLVQFAVNKSGFKFNLAKQLLPDFLSTRQYQWVWLLDEDVGLSTTDINKFVSLAQDSGSVIVQPSISSLTDQKLPRLAIAAFQCQADDLYCSLLRRHPQCHYRHTNYVEVMAPLLRQDALRKVLQDCPQCVHERTTWGLDLVWCSWISRTLGVERSCAVVDEVSLAHHNFKTLGKWNMFGLINKNEIKTYWKDRDDMQARFPLDFATEVHTDSCVSL